jgi:hypothetical protein
MGRGPLQVLRAVRGSNAATRGAHDPSAGWHAGLTGSSASRLSQESGLVVHFDFSSANFEVKFTIEKAK